MILLDVAAKHHPVFLLQLNERGFRTNFNTIFPTEEGARPVDRAPYRMSPVVQYNIDTHVGKLSEQGIIEEHPMQRL